MLFMQDGRQIPLLKESRSGNESSGPIDTRLRATDAAKVASQNIVRQITRRIELESGPAAVLTMNYPRGANAAQCKDHITEPMIKNTGDGPIFARNRSGDAGSSSSSFPHVRTSSTPSTFRDEEANVSVIVAPNGYSPTQLQENSHQSQKLEVIPPADCYADKFQLTSLTPLNQEEHTSTFVEFKRRHGHESKRKKDVEFNIEFDHQVSRDWKVNGQHVDDHDPIDDKFVTSSSNGESRLQSRESSDEKTAKLAPDLNKKVGNRAGSTPIKRLSNGSEQKAPTNSARALALAAAASAASNAIKRASQPATNNPNTNNKPAPVSRLPVPSPCNDHSSRRSSIGTLQESLMPFDEAIRNRRRSSILEAKPVVSKVTQAPAKETRERAQLFRLSSNNKIEQSLSEHHSEVSNDSGANTPNKTSDDLAEKHQKQGAFHRNGTLGLGLCSGSDTKHSSRRSLSSKESGSTNGSKQSSRGLLGSRESRSENGISSRSSGTYVQGGRTESISNEGMIHLPRGSATSKTATSHYSPTFCQSMSAATSSSRSSLIFSRESKHQESSVHEEPEFCASPQVALFRGGSPLSSSTGSTKRLSDSRSEGSMLESLGRKVIMMEQRFGISKKLMNKDPFMTIDEHDRLSLAKSSSPVRKEYCCERHHHHHHYHDSSRDSEPRHSNKVPQSEPSRLGVNERIQNKSTASYQEDFRQHSFGSKSFGLSELIAKEASQVNKSTDISSAHYPLVSKKSSDQNLSIYCSGAKEEKAHSIKRSSHGCSKVPKESRNGRDSYYCTCEHFHVNTPAKPTTQFHLNVYV